MAILQRIGRSLMMPIAVLPAAAILLRLGQPDMLGTNGPAIGGLADVPGFGWMAEVAPVVGAAGSALFDNLPLLFAIGVAIGFARKADGSTALAALVGYLVFDRVSKVMFFAFDGPQGDIGSRITVYQAAVDASTREPTPDSLAPTINYSATNPTSVLGGILIGLVAALLWQRFHRIKLPTWLGFFGGRRFVPIITALSALGIGVILGFIWPVVGGWINDFGQWIMGAGALGAGIYGVINRLLLPLGLHHIINSLIWFVFGSYEGPDGTVHGELTRYFAGDPSAGGFVAGWFPVLMFGLPAAALAIWRAAHPSQRPIVGGLMISAALTAFVTGITEPIEYAFIFIAPVLYGVHIVLTGISMAVMYALGAQLGFGFSAGLIDLLLNALKPNTQGLLLILGMGVLYAVIYYLIFYFLITKLNLPTPGREPVEEKTTGTVPASEQPASVGGEPAAGDAQGAPEASSPTESADRKPDDGAKGS